MKKKKKFLSYDQQQLKHLSDVLCDDVEKLFGQLGIASYKMLDKMVIMSCPIHGGDNDSAFNLYHQGESYRGNWKCRTHQCEEVFKSSIIGFIRGCLSHEQGWGKPGDPMVSFSEALHYAIDFSKQDPSKLKTSRKSKEKNNFINTVQHLKDQARDNNNNLVPRKSVIKALQIPSQYFIDRGFSSSILIKYDVGDCTDNCKEMANRAVVPVYEDTGEYMVGCTGRSMSAKCSHCTGYHVDQRCPDKIDLWKHSKWKHNKNFKTQEYLYNYWFAKEHISKSSTVILVESPGNVWRLEEAGIHNSVAIFGSSLSNKQKMILDTSGAMHIITLMDNDDAGRSAAKNIEEKCGRIYNIKHLYINHSDVAEMSVDQIQTELLPQIKDYI